MKPIQKLRQIIKEEVRKTLKENSEYADDAIYYGEISYTAKSFSELIENLEQSLQAFISANDWEAEDGPESTKIRKKLNTAIDLIEQAEKLFNSAAQQVEHQFRKSE